MGHVENTGDKMPRLVDVVYNEIVIAHRGVPFVTGFLADFCANLQRIYANKLAAYRPAVRKVVGAFGAAQEFTAIAVVR